MILETSASIRFATAYYSHFNFHVSADQFP